MAKFDISKKGKKILALTLCGVIGVGAVNGYAFNQLTLNYHNHYNSIKEKLENFVNDSNSAINQLKEEKAELNQTIETHLATINSKEQTIVELTATIEQMEADGLTKDENYNNLLAEKTQLENDIIELNKTIEGLNATITEKENEILALENENSDKDEEIAYYLNVIAQFESDSATLENEVDEILGNSTVAENEAYQNFVANVVNNVTNVKTYDDVNASPFTISAGNSTNYQTIVTQYTHSDGTVYYLTTKALEGNVSMYEVVVYDVNGNVLATEHAETPIKLTVNNGTAKVIDKDLNALYVF